jgi:molecular chaperone GrpE
VRNLSQKEQNQKQDSGIAEQDREAQQGNEDQDELHTQQPIGEESNPESPQRPAGDSRPQTTDADDEMNDSFPSEADGEETKPAPEDEGVSLAELEEQLQQARQQAEEAHQKLLRTQADFDNYRKRVRKEKEDQAKFAAQPLVEKLLPVLDNFERALAAAGAENEETESLLKGIQMVYDQLQQALEQEGVTVIPTAGETFDPHIHEAVMQVQEEGYDSGVVVEELQKGYLLNERVVRPAMVKVNA